MREEVQKEVREKQKEMKEENIKRIVLLCRKLTSTKDTAVDELISSYSFTKQEAEEKVDLYW